ncbi:hypothetical protein TNCV_789281 [Trichonephila clavipes]|nr:hypothetical protein TNCV_789281 [Trichonephila clavipes]
MHFAIERLFYEENREMFKIALYSNTRAIGNGPRYFEPRSSEKDDRAALPLQQTTTSCQREYFEPQQILSASAVLHSGSSMPLDLELSHESLTMTTRLPQT